MVGLAVMALLDVAVDRHWSTFLKILLLAVMSQAIALTIVIMAKSIIHSRQVPLSFFFFLLVPLSIYTCLC